MKEFIFELSYWGEPDAELRRVEANSAAEAWLRISNHVVYRTENADLLLEIKLQQ